MSGLWGYFWPILALALVVGAAAGTIAFPPPRVTDRNRSWGRDAILARWKRNQRLALAGGALLALAAAAAWHGPGGAAARLAGEIEAGARTTLVNYEMTAVTARLHRNLLTRRLLLSGPADDFQRRELVRIMGAQPGVTSAGWDRSAGGLPLLIEALLAALAGYGAGLVLAYVVELRRRVNREWRW